jgi:AcrR family transcriptional regulator
MSRKQQILDTALVLFNAHGTHQITTNHIAQEMGISPGNLYYHYKNKEHIVRELLARLKDEFSALLQMDSGLAYSARAFHVFVTQGCNIIFRYRFIYAELATLLNRDPLFKEMYVEIKRERVGAFESLFQFLSQKGLLIYPLSAEDARVLFFVIWTYVEGLITSMNTSDVEITPDNVKNHFLMLFHLIRPFVKPEIWTQLGDSIETS